MSPEWVLGFALALLVGFSLGLLGGGGSILTVPILTYVFGIAPQEAIAASLFIVAVTSAFASLPHARAGRVRWNIGLGFGLAGMLGAFLGGLVGAKIPGPVLMVLFAAMMITTAGAMLKSAKPGLTAPTLKKQRSMERTGVLGVGRIIIDGAAVGFATGLVGAGGGFLVVPALTLLGGLTVAVAVGTSLVVIVLKSVAGLSGYLLSVQFDWPIVLLFTTLAVSGSFLGSALVGKISEQKLRVGFALFVLVMGIIVLLQEVPSALGLIT